MAKVYLLTSGDYSDFRVVGVFSSMEVLQRTIDPGVEDSPDWNANRAEFRVMEFEVDRLPERSLGPLYRVCINVLTGEITRDGVSVQMRLPSGPCHVRHQMAWPVEPKRLEQITVCSPQSYEHAEKVAIEKRQEWLRTGVVGERDNWLETRIDQGESDCIDL